ncbi:hypothetical protein GSY71_00185 [Pusillimonas sp. TS35]|uniref:FAS1-like dehydratase domain-containing protein n=1 Tax=Paracandidimonas lactea TaxID=2895524 RepID=UPI00136C9886|nr:MaoC family dehydratase N-terminal domain-containing protein [Paracandidimonas lactea]MYN11577.1 hypothetical protein [Pusillimonas sp. TS35]
MDDSIINEWQDRLVGHVKSFYLGVIDPLWSQRYAIAVDDLDPVYFDDDAAARAGLKGVIAPPNYIATLRAAPGAGPSEVDLLEDGTSPDGRPAIPGLQIMGGGQSIEFLEPVYCGEKIWGDKKIKSITSRESKSGKLIIIEEEIIYKDESSVTKIVLINKSLYRIVEGFNGNAE